MSVPLWICHTTIDNPCSDAWQAIRSDISFYSQHLCAIFFLRHQSQKERSHIWRGSLGCTICHLSPFLYKRLWKVLGPIGKDKPLPFIMPITLSTTKSLWAHCIHSHAWWVIRRYCSHICGILAYNRTIIHMIWSFLTILLRMCQTKGWCDKTNTDPFSKPFTKWLNEGNSSITHCFSQKK